MQVWLYNRLPGVQAARLALDHGGAGFVAEALTQLPGVNGVRSWP